MKLETIEIIVIIPKINFSFLCQNFGAIRGIMANDNRTKIKGKDNIDISKQFNLITLIKFI